MIDGYIVTDLGGLPNHHTHAVIDKKPPANGCARVNFNAAENARNV